MHIAFIVLVIVLIIVFPRAAGFTILAAIGGVIFLVYSVVDGADKRAARRESILSKMSLNVSYESGKSCTETHPILVVFNNNSTATVTKFRADIIARPDGYSSVVVDRPIESDKIIQPGENFRSCYNIGTILPARSQSPDQFKWSFRNAKVDF